MAYRLSEAKELALYTWASSVLGITAIWDKPDAPRPVLPYVTLNFSSGPRSVGKSELRYKETDTFTYTFRKVITLTVNVYAENAYLEYISTLINSLELDTVQETLRDAELAVWGTSDPVDISQLLDTKHEFRTSVDIFIAYAIEVDDIPGEIQTVSVNGSIGDFNTDQIQSIEIYASRLGSASLTADEDDMYFIDDLQNFTDYLTTEGDRQYIIIFVDTEGRRAFAYIGERKDVGILYIYISNILNIVTKYSINGDLVKLFDTLEIGEDTELVGIDVDIDGNIYLADNWSNILYKFDADGNFLISSTGNQGDECLDSPCGLWMNSTHIFIADSGNNRIKKYDLNGNFITKWGSFGTGDGEFDYPYLSYVDENYIYVPDSGNHRIQKFDLVGNFVTEWGSEGTGDGQFSTISGMVKYNDRLYVVDRKDNSPYLARVQVFDFNGNFITKWGEFGTGEGQFKPVGIDVDSNGNIYIADTYNHRIQKYDLDGNFVLQWGSGGTGDGQFDYPYTLKVDSDNNIFVGDNRNHRVQKFNSNGDFLGKFGSEGSSDGRFNSPYGIFVLDNGNIYVKDLTNCNVQIFNSDFDFLSKFGVKNGLNSPYGLKKSGNYIYISDMDNNRIQKFDTNLDYISEFGGFGTDNGEFSSPRGVAVDSSGNVYVADTENYRVQKFNSAGIYQTQWGSYGSGDGEFYEPHGIAVDSSGNVYVADTYNYRVQKFDSNGNFLAKWGSYGTGDGEFDEPSAIEAGSDGNIYVLDTYNYRIQVFDDSGNYLNQIALSEESESFGITISSVDNPEGPASGIFLYIDSTGLTQGLASQDENFDVDNIKNYAVIKIDV